MSVTALRPRGTALSPDAMERFAAVRLRAVDACPYLATALYRLVPVCAPGLGTFAVDRYWRVYVDPVTLFEWTVPEAAGVMLHEAGHVIRAHAERSDIEGVQDHLRWNYAGDAEINDDLLEAGITLPQGVITPAAMGWPLSERAEVYYRHGFPPGFIPAGDGGDGGDGDGDGDGSCGSGAGGRARSWELDPLDTDAPDMSEGEADLTRRQVAQDVQNHAKSRGTVPSGWASWAADVLAPPKVDWRRQFAGAIRTAVARAAGMVDYSYTRPGRRRVPKVLTPSMFRPTPSVAVVMDTSGSMSDDDLRAAASEIQGMVRRAGVSGEQLKMLATDAAVHGVQAVRRVQDLEFRGRGGTDMCVGIAAAMALRPVPDVIVVLTDGETPWPEARPNARVVVGLVRSSSSPNPGYAAVPEWARVVHIPSDGLAG